MCIFLFFFNELNVFTERAVHGCGRHTVQMPVVEFLGPT